MFICVCTQSIDSCVSLSAACTYYERDRTREDGRLRIVTETDRADTCVCVRKRKRGKRRKRKTSRKKETVGALEDNRDALRYTPANIPGMRYGRREKSNRRK